jgi:hypothetical protein
MRLRLLHLKPCAYLSVFGSASVRWFEDKIQQRRVHFVKRLQRLLKRVVHARPKHVYLISPAMDLEAMRTSSKAAHSRSKAAQERKRNVLVLVMRFLADQGYAGSAQCLSGECNVSLNNYDCADNMDLMQIIQVCAFCITTACAGVPIQLLNAL